eukprot:scaffold43978_cov66-Phaeocystis_antarctica.AAC.6
MESSCTPRQGAARHTSGTQAARGWRAGCESGVQAAEATAGGVWKRCAGGAGGVLPCAGGCSRCRVHACMVRRKQLDIWGVLVPALNMVGEACVNHFSLMRLYVSMAESMSR